MSKLMTSYLIALMAMVQTIHGQEVVSKSYCMSAIDYRGGSESLKRELLVNAKRLAVSEIFGELITAFTAVENFTMTEDSIRASSIGFVRIKGVPYYFNGTSFGEACVSIQAFATDGDKAQFRPREISKKNCSSDRNLTTLEIKNLAKEQAIVSALVDYERKLQSRSVKELLQLVHRVAYQESGFIPDTETYCVRFTGTIYPIEILALTAEGGDSERPREELPPLGSGDRQVPGAADWQPSRQAQVAAMKLVIEGGVTRRVHLTEIEFFRDGETIPLYVESCSSDNGNDEHGCKKIIDGDSATSWINGEQDDNKFPYLFILRPIDSGDLSATSGRIYSGVQSDYQYRLSYFNVYITDDMAKWRLICSGRLDISSPQTWEQFGCE